MIVLFCMTIILYNGNTQDKSYLHLHYYPNLHLSSTQDIFHFCTSAQASARHFASFYIHGENFIYLLYLHFEG